MDGEKLMIIANGRIITSDVSSINFNNTTKKYDICFNNGKTYSYNRYNVLILTDPIALDPTTVKITCNSKLLYNISAIFVFSHQSQSFYFIKYSRGEAAFFDYELNIKFSCLDKENKVFSYLRKIAALSQIKTEDGNILLEKVFEKIDDFVPENVALAEYLQPQKYPVKKNNDFLGLFPYGINRSQYSAVKSALENSVSIIQGPPGTGKTQTIINIICNIIAQKKTVLVVSNNNTALENIIQKLSAPEFDLSFLIAKLGKTDNKKDFLSNQPKYPDFEKFGKNIDLQHCKNIIDQKREIVYSSFENVEKSTKAKQELAAIEVEYKHFLQNFSADIHLKKNINSSKALKLWIEFQKNLESNEKPSLLTKIKMRWLCGIKYKQYSDDFQKAILCLQNHYYKQKINELKTSLSFLENQIKLSDIDRNIEELKALSRDYLAATIKKRYKNSERPLYTEKNLIWENELFRKEFPIVLSTTFASRSILGKEAVFDYVIMDEASQVDVATGALALSCAKNAVIVGDDRQLPNIVTERIKNDAKKIFEEFNINNAYDYAKNSFLKSVAQIIPQAPITLLKEHYRCHPKIINFCNQKFYGGQLIVMTKDNGEKDVISVTKTVEGNHSRGHLNRRQIDIVQNEVLPELIKRYDDIGIIAPYNDQIDAVQAAINDKRIDIATVHKFQGQERSAIILMTVDDKVNDFSDDPYLLNVAISRAKNKLDVIISGNELSDSNIADLVDYIEYNNFSVKNSGIRSVFDFLYSQYSQMRMEYLQGTKKVSEYDSENLMYKLIKNLFKKMGLYFFNVITHVPLKSLIDDFSLMNEEQKNYAMQNGTHVDFIVYSTITKKVVLAIEVDGYGYHMTGTKQSERDKIKNAIFELYSIPYLRFSTNGSGEEAILKDFFQKYVMR